MLFNGEYNINLMKHTRHNPTLEFLDLMFSNIFTNELKNEKKYMKGILTSDISDH